MATLAPEPAPPKPIQRFIALASYVLVIAVLFVAKDVIVPVVFAALLAFLLSPAVVRLTRWGLPKVLAIVVVVLIGFGALGALGWLVATQMVNLAEQLPAYERNIQQKIASFKEPSSPGALERTSDMLRKFQREIEKERPKERVEVEVDASGVAGPTEEVVEEPEAEPVRVRVEEESSSLDLVGALAGTVLGPLALAGIVVVLFVAMLLQREDLRDRFIKVVSAGRINVATQALDDAARRVSRYLLMQLVVNATYGIPVGIGLYLIGVPNASLWGLMATLLRFIPFLGPWIAASFPVALAFAVDPGWSMIAYTLLLFLVMELVSNNIIEVWLYGAGTGISNLALLVAAVFWTWLWGPVGLVLSTPVTVCLLVLGKYVPGLRFLSTLLGSESVLEPPAQFYQRMLSMDADEMLELAVDFVEERSLGAFYDEMFLPALLLAEEDRHRGALAEVRQQFIFRSGRELIDELERRGETEPGSAWRVESGEAPLILGVPATDDADELVALMLRHLLRERGLRVEVSAVAASPEEPAERLRRERVAVVFVSALPPSALSAARRACRRLKQAAPGVRVVAGIWARDATTADLRERLRHPRPDAVVTRLSDAAAQIETLAKGSASVDASPCSADGTADEATRAQVDARRLGLTGSEPEAWVEKVTRALAQVFEVPVSLVTIIEADTEFWPARLGLAAEGEEAREPSLRAFVRELATEEDLLVIDDARKDRRLAQKTFVTERGVRLFAGLVLRTQTGHAVGHLCVVDTTPHEVSEEQRERLCLHGRELVEAVEALRERGAAGAPGTSKQG